MYLNKIGLMNGWSLPVQRFVLVCHCPLNACDHINIYVYITVSVPYPEETSGRSKEEASLSQCGPAKDDARTASPGGFNVSTSGHKLNTVCLYVFIRSWSVQPQCGILPSNGSDLLQRRSFQSAHEHQPWAWCLSGKHTLKL